MITVGISTTLETSALVNLSRALVSLNKNHSLIECLIVVQKNLPNIEALRKTVAGLNLDFKVVVVGSNTRGLAASRNAMISLCDTRYLLFGDDDVYYLEKLGEKIQSGISILDGNLFCSFVSINERGVIRNKRFSGARTRRHSLLSITSVSSIELLIDVTAVRRVGVSFDERFGLGTRFSTGAENIFMSDLLRRGGGIFINELIVVHVGPSSGGGSGQRRADFAMAKGAMYKRLFGRVLGSLYLISFYFWSVFFKRRGIFRVGDLRALICGFLAGPNRH